jgi:hypothetical protein
MNFRPGDVTWVDETTDPYRIVLADLRAQRDRIEIAINAITALAPGVVAAENEKAKGAPRWTDIEEDTPPAPAPPQRVIPRDPAELKAMALRLSNSGYGLGEVKTMLELTSAQMQDYFGTDI